MEIIAIAIAFSGEYPYVRCIGVVLAFYFGFIQGGR